VKRNKGATLSESPREGGRERERERQISSDSTGEKERAGEEERDM